MAGERSVLKELHGLLRHADKLFDGQVKIEICDNEGNEDNREDEDAVEFLMTVTPNDGLYKDAKCLFKVKILTDFYPDQPPEVRCLNNIYHPNINLLDDDCGEGGDICVNMLDSDWQPEVGLDGCVMAVLFLFYNPQIDDALNPVCTNFDDWSDYVENVTKSLRGEEIDGYHFDRLIEIDENENKIEELLDVTDNAVKDNNGNELNVTPENVPEKPSEEQTTSETDQLQDKLHDTMTHGDQACVPHEETNQEIQVAVQDEMPENDQSQNIVQEKMPETCQSFVVVQPQAEVEETAACEESEVPDPKCQALEITGIRTEQSLLHDEKVNNSTRLNYSLFKLWFIKMKERLLSVRLRLTLRNKS